MIFMIKVDMTGPLNKSHIKEGNMKSTTSRGFKMHMLYQFQLETAILNINLCTHLWITFTKEENNQHRYQATRQNLEEKKHLLTKNH